MTANEPPPSKSQRKRDMLALQALGERLVGLAPGRLERLPLPTALREAVDHARTIAARGGRKRQLQYIGRLMREVDPAPIRAALAALDAGGTAERDVLHRTERWRAALLEDPAAIDALRAAFPHAELDALAVIVEQARRERRDGRPPRRQRELFRALRSLLHAR